MKRNLMHYYGCLVGGAIGDAWGAPVEFLDYQTIVEEYGEEGVKETHYTKTKGLALISDDTQMSMFTAEGLLRARSCATQKGKEIEKEGIKRSVFRSYLRWLYTQGLGTVQWKSKDYDGYLIGVKALHAYRNPALTCITALGRGTIGTIEQPINEGKGCGGIMRIAPVGLFIKDETAFDVGCELAALTHGDPLAYLPAGALALMIQRIIMGDTLDIAVWKMFMRLKGEAHGKEIVQLLEKAISLVSEGEPNYEKVEALGKGYLGHETLAIATYCALSAQDDFTKGVQLAINHGGNSDTTAAVTGNILGAYLGANQISDAFKQHVECQKELEELAKDLLMDAAVDEVWLKKYPAW